MKVLIVGPTGPVGRRLTQRLAEAGHELVLFARRSTEGLLPEGARVVQGDVDDRARLLEAAEGCEAAYHLVAWAGRDFSVAREQLRDLWRINVLGTRTVVACLLEAGVRRLVYTSTHLTGGATPAERFTPYLVSRHLAEGEVFRAGARGMEALVVAPALIVGSESGPFTRLLADLSEGRIPLFPEETKVPLVTIEDVVEAHVAALEKGRPGLRYLLRGANLGWRTLGDLVGMATGWPVILRPVSARTAELAARLDERLLSKLTRRTPRGPPERFWALTHQSDDDPAVAERDLELTWSDVEAGIRRQLEGMVGSRRIGGD